uniref:Steroid receptor RNA activator 1-like n=1 Tax=Ciona intestinalis TaxID=7719 RepID=F6Y820_CIOIN|nr:steroid receptor RNA activator 1-like [Ciona intestinalis]|eukprot:XP_002131049.1 steroid receptor RNA activator 1-like [Ciona intestinalis]
MEAGGPGWNDPPKLAYANAPKRRNLLNKRVSHLTDETKAVTSAVPLFTPTISDVNSKVTIMLPENVSSGITSTVDDKTPEHTDDGLEPVDIVGELLNLTQICEEQCTTSGAQDIRKKLELLQNSMDAGDVSKDVVTKMEMLTKELLGHNYQQAWNIHVELMCNHVSEVRNWMVGVKRLISELRNLKN